MEFQSSYNDSRQRPYDPPHFPPPMYHHPQQSHGFSSSSPPSSSSSLLYPKFGQSGQPVIPPPARSAPPPHPYYHPSSNVPPLSSSGPGVGVQYKPEYRITPPIMSNHSSNVFNLRSTLEKDKLNSKNFLDWERNLRIVLRCEGKESVLDTPIPTELPATATHFERAARQSVIDNSILVTCLMLSCMESDFQKRFDKMDAYSIIQELKSMHQQHARLERFELNCKILGCKLKKGQLVGPHVFNMIGYFQEMEKLGFSYPLELSIDIIMNSLHEGFYTYRGYFYMQGGKVSLQELHRMLVQAEKSIPKDSPQLIKDAMSVKNTTKFKKDGVSKTKKEKDKKIAKSSSEKAKKSKVAAEDKCFHCNEIGHWKRNCPIYLDDLKDSSN